MAMTAFAVSLFFVAFVTGWFLHKYWKGEE